MKLIDADMWMNLGDNLPYKASVKRVLIQAPEAVVRCKNCALWRGSDNYMITEDGTKVQLGKCAPMRFTVNENDFCSCGERKGDT